ncbi:MULTISPECIES: hypothetical protein [unclassified Haladaptatus]|uniref:hypothetical protein n=1 Tax=unclassified Haladaptatus TaxID=2622732 RepID=UPI0023E88269|nr:MULTISPECIES: hypothetical protein [unclassified Haladaptatus]
MSNGTDEPSDTMRGRVPESRVKLWFLMGANRWLVAGLLLVAFFVTLVILGALDPTLIRKTMSSKDPTETLFQAFVTAIITGVTLVVTLNQLVLSQELGPIGDQRDRMEGAMQFQTDVEEALGVQVSPAEPSRFLKTIIEFSGKHAAELKDALDGNVNDDERDHITRFTDSVTGNADEVTEELDEAQFGTFDVLSAALDYNYSWKVYEARRIQNQYGDKLNDEASEALQKLRDALTFFGPAREHFKTLYFQWELINLSRAMMYSAIPALIVATVSIIYLDSSSVMGTFLGLDNLVWVVSAASAISIVPFVILLAFVMRIATVAKHTLSIGSFILRDTEGSHKTGGD